MGAGRFTVRCFLVAALMGSGGCPSDLEGFRVADGPGDGSTVDAGLDGTDAAAGSDGASIVDGGGDGSLGMDAGGGSDGSTDSGAAVDGGGEPAASCRDLVLPCLDSSPENVIEVPTESSSEAFDIAQAGDTIQIRGMHLTSTWWLPPLVTLRGCEGAQITGAVAFEGTGGIVEGFDVTGQVVANRTGSYIVRENRFVGEAVPDEPAVSGRSIDGIVDAEVELTVESNLFADRGAGIEASTYYDVGDRTVALTVRNNIFSSVAAPLAASEGGLVGEITLVAEHNTLYDFEIAADLRSLSARAILRANLFVHGEQGVAGDSVYDAPYSMIWDVTTPFDVAPFDGPLTVAESTFVAPADGNFALAPGSAAIDAVPGSTISDDYYGCARPVSPGGTSQRSDVGAIELQ